MIILLVHPLYHFNVNVFSFKSTLVKLHFIALKEAAVIATSNIANQFEDWNEIYKKKIRFPGSKSDYTQPQNNQRNAFW